MSEEEKLQLENECLLKYSKAQMIQKYIDELEENCILSNLWCKSQEKIKEVREYIENNKEYTTIKKPTKKWQYSKVIFEESDEDILTEDMIKELLEILEKEK